eukprot:14416447-Heterocapsa_arctica.AAC.1
MQNQRKPCKTHANPCPGVGAMPLPIIIIIITHNITTATFRGTGVWGRPLAIAVGCLTTR